MEYDAAEELARLRAGEIDDEEFLARLGGALRRKVVEGADVVGREFTLMDRRYRIARVEQGEGGEPVAVAEPVGW
jgi:hypothetical protein